MHLNHTKSIEYVIINWENEQKNENIQLRHLLGEDIKSTRCMNGLLINFGLKTDNKQELEVTAYKYTQSYRISINMWSKRFMH